MNPVQSERDKVLSMIPTSGSLAGLLTSLRALLSSFLGLALCEARVAGINLAIMVGFGLAAAMLLTIGLGTLIACVVFALVTSDVLGWPAALMAAAVLCFAASGALVALLVRRSGGLSFKATRRQLGGT